MSFGLTQLLLLLGVCFLSGITSARSVVDVWPFPWFLPPPEPEVKPHSIPPLHITELPAPDAPPTVNWFSANNKNYHAAVLIAGSKGYRNYRHQADVCHAYRILRERGLKDDSIITFVYDDIAYNTLNPYEGQIFNSPGGHDVYPGCAKDYTGKDVNKDNVLAVLVGKKDAVRGVGSGRVLIPNPKQRIFIFYSDHGSVGSVGMPTGRPLTAKELNNAFAYMTENKFFDELVFYLESCESGSMFHGFNYDRQSNVLAVSASKPEESSFATYCRSDSAQPISPNASYIGSCLGDLFSVSWMEYTESHDVAVETIEKQLAYTNERTSDNHKYYMGSHMVIYGRESLPIRQEVIGNFLSYFNVPSGLSKKDAYEAPPSEGEDDDLDFSVVNGNEHVSMEQRDADLMFLVQRTMSNDFKVRESATKELQEALQQREESDRAIRSIVATLMDNGLLENATNDADVEAYVTKLFLRGKDRQVVDDWDCFDSFVDVWFQMCGEMDDYSRQYTRTFANLCNTGISVADFARATMHACSTNKIIYPTA